MQEEENLKEKFTHYKTNHWRMPHYNGKRSNYVKIDQFIR